MRDADKIQLLEKAKEAAVHNACLIIQTELGVTTGDTAGLFFSNPLSLHDFEDRLTQYIDAELDDIELAFRDEVKTALQTAHHESDAPPDIDDAADAIIELLKKKELI